MNTKHTAIQIQSLTPLRGIASFLVLLLHYQIHIAVFMPRSLTISFEKLYLMVDMFFILSGMIMYHVYGPLFQSSVSRANYYRFIRARFARIYPLHFATLMYLVALYLLVGLTNADIGFWEKYHEPNAILSNLFLTQAMGTHVLATWNSPAWSISVEWWAYIIFPVIVLALTYVSSWARWVIGIVIIVTYLVIMYILQPILWSKIWVIFNLPPEYPYPEGILNVPTGLAAFLRCLCGFIFGMLLYELYQKNWARPVLGHGAVFISAWGVLFLGWYLEVLPDVVAVFICGIIIISAAYNSGHTRNILNNRFFSYLGDISFTLYLVHLPVLITYCMYRKVRYQPDEHELPVIGFNFSIPEALLGLFVYLVVIFVISGLSYKYFEKPLRDYLRK